MDSSIKPAKCARCQTRLESPVVCTGCHALYPMPQSVDYFELLGVERGWNIDIERLNAAFRALARSVHPDRFSGQPQEVRALSTRLAAEINTAFTVLKDPARRADYLLELAGGPSGSDERGVPGNLLGEVMMLREEIEQAAQAGDRAALAALRESILGRRERTLDRVATLAVQLDQCTDQQRRELRLLLNAVRYFDSLIGELSPDPFQSSSEVTRA